MLFANDPALLAPAAKAIVAKLAKVPGLVAVRDGIVIAGDGFNISVDPTLAAFEGVDAAMESAALDSYLSGTVATQLPQSTKQIGVRVWLPGEQRQYDDQLLELPIRTLDGQVFALGRVATVSAAPGQAEIQRKNLQRIVALTARLQSRSLGSAVADAKKLLDQNGAIPPGVRYELGGLYAQ